MITRAANRRVDRVTLNSTPNPVPQQMPQSVPVTPPRPKPIRDEIKLSFDNLDNPPLPSEGQAILESFGKAASLKAMWSKIRATAPQMEGKGTTLKANYYKDEDWSNFRLTGTQQTEHGELSVTSRYNPPVDGKPAQQHQEINFEVDGQAGLKEMPSVLQEAWEKSGALTPEKITSKVENLLPSDAKPSKTRFYASNLDKETPHTSMSWTRTTEEGVDIRYSHNVGRNSASMNLTPEQFKAGALPKPVEQQLKKFGLSKDLFDNILSDTGLEASKYRIGIMEKDGQEMLTFGMTLSDGSKDVGSMDRHFTNKVVDGKETREVFHAGLRLDDEFQGQGLGKKLLANSFDMYKKAGVDEVCLTASMTVGGYAWGRYGFQLLDDKDNAKSINEQVQGRLSELKLDARTQSTVEKLLKSDNPKRIWALADLDKKVTRDGKETKLGKALLLGNRWRGRFDMHDAASQKRLSHYLSK